MTSASQPDTSCYCGGRFSRIGPSFRSQWGIVRIVSCTCCGVSRASDVPTVEVLHQLYAGASVYRPPTSGAFAEQKKRFSSMPDELARFGFRTGRVLDVGCNAGYALSAFEDAGWQTTGIEANLAVASTAATLIEGEIHHDLSALGTDRRFEVVLLSHVLEHILEPRDFLRKLVSYLVPRGLIVVLVPNYGSLVIRYGLGGRWSGFIPVQHIWYFTNNTLKKLLGFEGFSTSWIGTTEFLSFQSSSVIKSVLKSPVVIAQHLLPLQGGELRGIFRLERKPLS